MSEGELVELCKMELNSSLPLEVVLARLFPVRLAVDVEEVDVSGLVRLLEAKERRILFLEKRLAQRFEDTRQDYASRLRFFETIQKMVLQLFLEDVPPGVGLSHPEILEEFERKFPNVKTVFVTRRVQELAQAGKLWSCKDDEGRVRFYLRLKEEVGE